MESASGISKSKVALARRELVAEGLLTRKGKEHHLGSKRLLAERLSFGYAQVLRPKLVVGRFRFAEKTAELFLTRLHNSLPPEVKYALTGGPAADLLRHFYRAPEVPMFIEPCSRQTVHDLRLLPDSDGPVTLLRAFREINQRGLLLAPERELQRIDPARMVALASLRQLEAAGMEREFAQQQGRIVSVNESALDTQSDHELA